MIRLTGHTHSIANLANTIYQNASERKHKRQLIVTFEARHLIKWKHLDERQTELFEELFLCVNIICWGTWEKSYSTHHNSRHDHGPVLHSRRFVRKQGMVLDQDQLIRVIPVANLRTVHIWGQKGPLCYSVFTSCGYYGHFERMVQRCLSPWIWRLDVSVFLSTKFQNKYVNICSMEIIHFCLLTSCTSK